MQGYADALGNFTASRSIEPNTAYNYKAVFNDTASYFGSSQEVFTWGC
jgi:hypothetical protein